MEEGKTPQEVGSNTEPNLESLYAKTELFTFMVSGITFKARDLTTDNLFDITKKATVNGEVMQNIYAREIMKACIVEPKIEFERELRGIVVAQIIGELENVLGLTELAQKKWKMR